MIGILIVLAVAVLLSVAWVRTIDKGMENNEWERQRAKDKEEEDKEQEEYLREYIKKKQERKERKNATKRRR